MKNIFKKKWLKWILIILVISLLIIWNTISSSKQVKINLANVERGNVILSISGDGAVKAADYRKEHSKVTAQVEAIYFKEGDEVKAGDVIVKLDDSDYEVTVNTQRFNVAQAELSQKNVSNQVSNLKIVASSSGNIKGLNINEGSYVTNNMAICNIAPKNKYEITLQFPTASNIKVGDKASVFLVDSLETVLGEVSYVSDSNEILIDGTSVFNVIINVYSDKYVLTGIVASAQVNEVYKSTNQAKFISGSTSKVVSNSSGTVSKLYVKEGQFVNEGDLIAVLTNSDLSTSAQNAALSLQSLYDQLAYAEDKLNDYQITADIDGTITAQSIKVGDYVTTGTHISTISNTDEFEFEVPVDELDISKINYENEVLVTIDALPETIENPLVGRVTSIPYEGVTVGGVTDYYVKITIPKAEGLRISMNASAEIILSSAENVIYVPVEAIKESNGEKYVEIFKNDKTEKRTVTTGISNSAYIEIISGLTEGEKVVVPEGSIGGFGFLLNM